MQNWGHFEISCITNFNKIDPGTLINFGTNMSIFGVLEVGISVTGAPGDPKIFFEIYPHRCLKYILESKFDDLSTTKNWSI